MQKLSWKQTLGAAALVAGSAAMSQAALAQDTAKHDLQGLYSAGELMDADVYLKSAPKDDIGDVEDILLGEDMSVQALVIEAGGVLDMGDREFVVQKGDFTVETVHADNLDDIEYRVVLDLDQGALKQQPEYTNDWWQQAKTNAAQAWEQTKQGASSAWQSTKEATSNLLRDASNAIDGNN
ncbi:PRC-barrel domain containing protein [Salinicola sp. DM10]|uniref:PRC-barrel domain containing protein n=1 Tax=Salinicola sp. DM10 TaxID=2815721 RepID=UPI001A8D4B81|nr:PRC-barrel domain containing protein [Salinicola sp. DM10]MCE3027255.1 PRC-barrel domain containing protein [Salinicola sp. DM10]